MNYLMKATLVLFTLALTPLYAGFISAPSELKQAVDSIESLDEGRQFLDLCQKSGQIDLKFKALGQNQSTACWIGHERVIILNASREFTEGKKINSILFELNNSLTHNEFVNLNKLAYQNRISKTEFVESVERLEYNNVLKTRLIVEKGVELGLFPSDALMPIAPNFEEHFRVQILCGHSDAIAKQYEQISANSSHSFSATTKKPFVSRT